MQIRSLAALQKWEIIAALWASVVWEKDLLYFVLLLIQHCRVHFWWLNNTLATELLLHYSGTMQYTTFSIVIQGTAFCILQFLQCPGLYINSALWGTTVQWRPSCVVNLFWRTSIDVPHSQVKAESERKGFADTCNLYTFHSNMILWHAYCQVCMYVML